MRAPWLRCKLANTPIRFARGCRANLPDGKRCQRSPVKRARRPRRVVSLCDFAEDTTAIAEFIAPPRGDSAFLAHSKRLRQSSGQLSRRDHPQNRPAHLRDGDC